MNLGTSDLWEVIIMNVGDLVRFKHRGQNPPIGIVLGIRRPIKKGARWYYLVKWSNEDTSMYCSSGTIEKIHTTIK